MKNRTYFMNYAKIWETINDYNRPKSQKEKIKGAQIDTLLCIMQLYEEFFNNHARELIKKGAKDRKFSIDAFRIAKLAGYGTQTIKKHITKLRELGMINIRVVEIVSKSYYNIDIPLKYIISAKAIKN